MNAPNSTRFTPTRSLVLIGMMGSGKSAVGRKLAVRLSLPFADSDSEIETAAGMTITQFFEHYGEAEFRKGERRVISRLIEGPVSVISTGGGAFMDADTRALIRSRATSIWLKADIGTLLSRTARRDDRPLLKGPNPQEAMAKLLAERAPLYAEADVTVESDDRPLDENVDRVLQALSSVGGG